MHMFTLQVPVVYIRSKLWLHFCPVPIVLRMRRAKQPSKQLNSEAIRGAALCYMSPVVAGQCNILCAKCVFNVKEKDLSKHAMDCVVWATEKAADCQGDSESDENDEVDTGSEGEEGILQDKEKEEL